MWLYFGGRAVCFPAMKTFTLHDSSVSYFSFPCLCLPFITTLGDPRNRTLLLYFC